MSDINQIRLKNSCILNVPFHIYDKDFTFIVNGEEFKTSRIISDLLSTKISNIHKTDPTLDKFIINTKNSGHFSNILQLINFDHHCIPNNEFSFFIEVIRSLGSASFEFNRLAYLTEENVFEQLIIDEKEKDIESHLYKQDVEFISSHFYEFCEKNKKELKTIEVETLFDILSDSNLVLNDENQLLHFINEIYIENPQYSILYETVNFANVSTNEISEFINIFDVNHITNCIWQHICERLKEDNKQKFQLKNNERYNNSKKSKKSNQITNNNNKFNGESKTFSDFENNKGIIYYLNQESDGNIENEIEISSSSVLKTFKGPKSPINACLDNKEIFATSDIPNSSITFKFKNHRIIPTHYSILTDSLFAIPKSWVIEGSNDYLSWDLLDERTNFSNFDNILSINGNNSNDYQFIRMRLTDKTWNGRNVLSLQRIEFYGTLI